MYYNENHTKGYALLLLGFLLCLPFIAWGTGRIVKNILFQRAIVGHLKLAANANSIELAKEQLQIAVQAIEARNMTQGYTSILWTTPEENVGYWYTNIKTSLNLLENLPDTTTTAEKDIVLLKLRQTLLDHEAGHEVVTVPTSISVFPHNALWCLIGWITALIFCAGLLSLTLGFSSFLTT